jgi:predicted nucleotidyltransferase
MNTTVVAMQTAIQTHLSTIAQRYDVTILYACESGSRAWGFASPNSDYDVRFIYVHKLDWYLSIHGKRDVIEYMDDGVLDINGWDLRKALRLLQKGNAPLREWLHSPIVYYTREDLFSQVHELALRAWLPETLCRHYLSMTKRSLAAAKDASQAKLKTYLYALRPLLCCQWLIQQSTQPPMLIDELLSACLPENEPDIREFVAEILHVKRNSEETSTMEHSHFFETFLKRQMSELEPKIPKNPEKLSSDEFDRVFKQICLSES